MASPLAWGNWEPSLERMNEYFSERKRERQKERDWERKFELNSLLSFGFAEAANALGVRNALAILSAINFLGLCFTFFVPETKVLLLTLSHIFFIFLIICNLGSLSQRRNFLPFSNLSF